MLMDLQKAITNNGTVEEMIQQFKLLFESTLWSPTEIKAGNWENPVNSQ